MGKLEKAIKAIEDAEVSIDLTEALLRGKKLVINTVRSGNQDEYDETIEISID